MTYPIQRYLNTQAAYAPHFNADATYMLFISNITGVPQVWRVPLPDAAGNLGWPDQLTFAADRVMGFIPSPIPGDARLIYMRDAGGNENAQLFLLDPTTADETCLTDGHDDAMHMTGQWSQDGRWLTFSANRRDKSLFDLYLRDMETGEDTMIWQHDQPGYLWETQFSPDGQRVIVNCMYGSFDRKLFEVDIASKAVRMASPEDDSVIYYKPRYLRDSETVVMLTDLGTDFTRIATLDTKSQQVTTVYEDHWGVESLELASDGVHIAYSVNEGGISRIYLHNLETGETRHAPIGEMPGTIAFGLNFSHDGTMLAFDYTSATNTVNAYVWHLASDSIQQVTRASHGGVPMESFISPQLVHYPTFDADDNGVTRTIPAWLYSPATDADKVPVVVIVHGGPEGQSRPGFNFLAQYLLSAGYAVFVPNVRGSTGYGKAYSHLDDVEKRMDSVADLAYAAHWLKAQPGIDGERIVVYGGSYGGFMVLAAVTHYPDLWAAGVDIVGISNLATFLENTSDYRRQAREAEYGSLEHDRAYLESIAPINHIHRVKVPLLVIHGANDPRVPLSEADQMVAALKAHQVPVEYLVFDDEGHGVVKLKNKLVMYPAVVDFLSQYV